MTTCVWHSQDHNKKIQLASASLHTVLILASVFYLQLNSRWWANTHRSCPVNKPQTLEKKKDNLWVFAAYKNPEHIYSIFIALFVCAPQPGVNAAGLTMLPPRLGNKRRLAP